MIAALLRVVREFTEKYGHPPTVLAIPGCKAEEFCKMCDDILRASYTDVEIASSGEGLVIESLLGMNIRLCSGTRIGVVDQSGTRLESNLSALAFSSPGENDNGKN